MKRKGVVAFTMALMLAVPCNVNIINVANVYADTYEADNFTEGETDNGIKWKLTDEGSLTLTGSGALDDNCFTSRDDIISVVVGNGITSIGSNSFSNATCLEKVVLPDSVTTIKEDAFSGCNSLSNVTFSKKLTSIGDNAFFNCSILNNVKLYDKVTKLGKNAFSGCDGMQIIEVPSSVKSLGENVFEACEALTIYGVSNSTIHNYAKEYSINFVATKKIAKSGIKLSKTAFDYDGKEKKPTITVKYNKTTLKNKKDYTVEYSKGRKNIGKYTVTISGTGKYYGTYKYTYLVNVSNSKAYTVSGIKYKVTNKSSKTKTFTVVGASKSNIKTVTIPEKVTIGGKKYVVDAIADNAFKRKTKLTSVTIGKNIKSIGKSAFESCTKLENITIKTTSLSSKTVGNKAFKSVKSSAKFNLPASKYIVYKNLLKDKGANGRKQKFASK